MDSPPWMIPRVAEKEHIESAGHAPAAGKRKRTSKNNGPQSNSSKLDKKNDSTRILLECSDRMRDSATVMRNCLEKLNNPNDEEDGDARNIALTTLNTAILPFLENGWQVIRSAAIATSSLASIDVAHDRSARREKKKVVALRSEKPPTVQLIEHTTKKMANTLAKKNPSKKGLPPPVGKNSNPRPILEKPANGMQYTKLEAVIQLRKTAFGSMDRKRMMQRMIDLGYAPVKVRTLQRLMEQDAKGEVPIKNTPLRSVDPVFGLPKVHGLTNNGVSKKRGEKEVAVASSGGDEPPKTVQLIDHLLEPPENGDQYTRIEAVKHLRKTTLGSYERKQMMDRMIYLGYTPVNVRTLQRLMEQDSKGEVPIRDIPWKSGGPVPLLSDADIDEFIDMLGTTTKKNGGVSYDSKSVKEFIISKKKDRLESEGCDTPIVDDSRLKVDDKTVRNYMAIIGLKRGSRALNSTCLCL